MPETNPTEGQAGFEDAMTAAGVTGAVSDPLDMGFVANDINAVANSYFLDANPAARALLERIEIPLADVSNMTQRIANGESSDAEIDAMALQWIADNQDAVEGWIDAAIDAAR